MEIEHKQFLEANIFNWESVQNGFIRNLELDVLRMYEHIYRLYLDPNFVLTVWCGNCKMEMLTRLYTYYERLPKEKQKELLIEMTQEGDEIITFIVDEPKKRSRKPKK
jgi:hypothetical protein